MDTKFAATYPEVIARAIVETHAADTRADACMPLWASLVEAHGADAARQYVADVTTADDSDDHPHYWADSALEKVGARPTHVTVYELDRAYGGPEEGGWYFNTATVEHEVELSATDDVDAVIAELRTEYPEGTNFRSSVVRRGSDYSVRPGFRPGINTPVRRPHYE